MVEKRSSLQSIVLPVQGYSSGERVDMLTKSRIEVKQQSLRDVLGYSAKIKQRAYAEVIVISIPSIEA